MLHSGISPLHEVNPNLKKKTLLGVGFTTTILLEVAVES